MVDFYIPGSFSRSPFKLGMWEILCQSSPICFLHLFSKMGHPTIRSVCKEVRAPIPSGNDSKLGQYQISSDWRDISLQIHSGIAIKLSHCQIWSFCRELTSGERPTSEDLRNAKREGLLVLAIPSHPNHWINQPPQSSQHADVEVPWGRGHWPRSRVRREMRFGRHSSGKASSALCMLM